MDTLPSAVAWAGDAIEIIDQTRLPDVCAILRLTTAEAAVDAIRTLAVRGAPAIGGCGALAVVLGLDEARPATREDALAALDQVAARVGSARPTAVNLSWAMGRVRDAAAREATPAAMRARALLEAQRIVDMPRGPRRRFAALRGARAHASRRVSPPAPRHRAPGPRPTRG